MPSPGNTLTWSIICIVLGVTSCIHSFFIDPTKPSKQNILLPGRSWSGKEMQWRAFWGGIGTTTIGVLLLIYYLMK